MAAVSPVYYNSSDGDVLDAIVAGYYGDTLDGKVEAVLAANPGLAALGAVLDARVRILMPDLSTSGPSETVQLWG